jgi:hypothetical protein
MDSVMPPIPRAAQSTRYLLLLGIATLPCAVAWHRADAADIAQVQQAIARGAEFLRPQIGEAESGRRALIALALFKSGTPANSPEIGATIAAISRKVSNGEYKPEQDHLYEAGVEAMLLADVGGIPEAGTVHPYARELEAIKQYMLVHQLPNGGWDYPQGRPEPTGDTSVTQYAMLGLWAAARCGLEVAPDVWLRAIQWHVASQNSDGGFAYYPGKTMGDGQGASMLNMTINGIGNTYIAMMHLDPDHLPLLTDPKVKRAATPAAGEKRYGGVITAVDLSKPAGGDATTTVRPAKAEIPPEAAQLLSRAYGWLATRFTNHNKTGTGNVTYYYYSLERMAALANIETIGQANWFDVCADFLVKQQQKDGQWKLSPYYDERIDTCFVLLFLTRSTAKILRRPVPVDPIGSGLTKGHRGGLEDLENLTTDGTVKKSLGALDDLLKLLENPGDVNLQDVQEQIVEQVQITDRKALIGQKDLLVNYARHPNAEVRRTAIWALGRTDDFSLARLLINALDDPDLGVLIEARNALCWLARKPNGLGEPADPHENLPENATEDQKLAATATWHADLVRKWGTWYLQNRPYVDRGDEFEAALLQKIAAAK